MNLKLKYRIIKYNDDEYFTVESKPSNKFLSFFPWIKIDFFSCTTDCEKSIKRLINDKMNPKKMIIKEFI